MTEEPYFEIGFPLNLVAQTDAQGVLKALIQATDYDLTPVIYKEALECIERVQLNSQAGLTDVIKALSNIEGLKDFATQAKRVFVL